MQVPSCLQTKLPRPCGVGDYDGDVQQPLHEEEEGKIQRLHGCQHGVIAHRQAVFEWAVKPLQRVLVPPRNGEVGHNWGTRCCTMLQLHLCKVSIKLPQS